MELGRAPLPQIQLELEAFNFSACHSSRIKRKPGFPSDFIRRPQPQINFVFSQTSPTSRIVIMFFRPIPTLVSGALFTQVVFAALTPNQVVANIGVITTVSQKLNNDLAKLTTSLSFKDVEAMAQVIPNYRLTGLAMTRSRV
jgi:hypothetical protein